MSEKRGECKVCNIPCTKQCMNCKKAFYCGVDHQNKDWKNHKVQCKQYSQNQKNNGNAAPSSTNNQINQVDLKATAQFSAFQQNTSQRLDSNSQNIGQQGLNSSIHSGNNAIQQNQLKSQHLNSHNTQNYQQNFQNNPPTSRSLTNAAQADIQGNTMNNNLHQSNHINSPINAILQSQNSQLTNTIGLLNNNNNGYDNQSTINGSSMKNKEKEKSDTICSDINRLLMERMKLRSEVVNYMAKFQYNEAIIPAQNLCQKSEQIYDKQKKQNELYELLADQLLEVKILMKVKTSNENKQASSKLHDIFHKIKTRIDDNALKTLHQQTQFSNDPSKSKVEIEMKNQVMSEFRKRCNLISLVANLFYSLGYHKDCEEAYVRYVKLIENVFGPDALETSNCYFLMGVFYLQHRYYVKSLACFKRSMSIRQLKLTEKHESVTDCMYNIGIAYKQMGKKQKAYVYLEKALYLRRQVIGESSLPVAQTLEILGKVYIEAADYKIALNKFQECYSIRKSIIQNNKHPDLLRISLLIVHLYNLIKQQIQIQEVTQPKQVQVLKELDIEIQRNTIDSNIQNHIQLSKNQPERFQELQNSSGIQNMDIQNGISTMSSNQGFNKPQNLMMTSQNIISDNNGEEYLKSFQGNQNMNKQSNIQNFINSGLQQQNLPNSSNLQGQNKFKDQIKSVYSDRTGSFQSKDSSSQYKNKKVKEEISEDEEYSEDEERGQNNYFLNVKGSLLTRLTHQQMNELIKLNEQINQERKKDPLFNPRSLIINSLFIQLIKETNVKEDLQDLIEMNPKVFKQEDFDGLKYQNGDQINYNNAFNPTPFEKRIQQQNQYSQAYQPQQQQDFYQQNTFGSQNSFSNNQNSYRNQFEISYEDNKFSQENQRKQEQYNNIKKRNEEKRTEMQMDLNIDPLEFLANNPDGDEYTKPNQVIIQERSGNYDQIKGQIGQMLDKMQNGNIQN